MNNTPFANTSPLYIEFGASVLKVLRGEAGLELPLERQPDGKLTVSCKGNLATGLKNYLKRKSWQPRVRAVCAIGARGVSLRRLTLPASAKEEFQKVLLLQIESEFPLPPDELAWGYWRIENRKPSNGEPAKQHILVAAVKREIIEDYAETLSACGISPVFALSGVARSGLCPPSQAPYAVLDVADGQSELMRFEDGVPSSVRIFPSGQTGPDASLDSLAEAVSGNGTQTKLYVSGDGAGQPALAARLAKRLPNGVSCEPLAAGGLEGCSPAILGLKKLIEEHGGSPPLLMQVNPMGGSAASTRAAPRKWAVLAALLLAGLCAWPYAEALLFKPRLARELSLLKADKGRLQVIDRELSFLQFLKTNQPPYLDAVFVLSKAAPPGAHIDSLSMNRRGEVSLRGSVRDAQMVVQLRSKLLELGFFSTVAVEDQSPTPDRQKVNIRLSAQWKPEAARALLAIGPTREEIEKAATNQTSRLSLSGGNSGPRPPPGAFPLPPGL